MHTFRITKATLTIRRLRLIAATVAALSVAAGATAVADSTSGPGGLEIARPCNPDRPGHLKACDEDTPRGRVA